MLDIDVRFRIWSRCIEGQNMTYHQGSTGDIIRGYIKTARLKVAKEQATTQRISHIVQLAS